MASQAPLLAPSGPSSKLLHYILLSIPVADGDKEKAYKEHAARTGDLGQSSRFEIPDLASGTLDSLMNLSDELSKVDVFVEGVCRKIVQTLTEIVPENPQWSVTRNGEQVTPDQYLSTFKWDEKKYPWKVHLKEIVARINAQVQRLDADLRAKSMSYTTLARALAAESRKEAGTLMTRALYDLVKPEDLIETEYLTTVVVVVPRHMQKDWLSTYERLAEFVLPRSAKLLKEDGEFGLWTVTLFRRVLEDFKNAAREKRFTVRDIDKASLSGEQKEEREKRNEEKSKQEAHLIRWCKINFGEALCACAHIKAVRIFVESVLRYGALTKFITPIMKPSRPRDEKRNMGSLCKTYAHLGGGNSKIEVFSKVGAEDKSATEGLAGVSQEKYYPFVFSQLDVDLVRVTF